MVDELLRDSPTPIHFGDKQGGHPGEDLRQRIIIGFQQGDHTHDPVARHGNKGGLPVGKVPVAQALEGVLLHLFPGEVFHKFNEISGKLGVLVHLVDGDGTGCQTKMLFHPAQGVFHRGAFGALHPEIVAVFDIGVPLLVEAFQRFPCYFLCLLHIGGTVQKVAETLMIGTVAVIVDQIAGVFDQKGHTGRIGDSLSLFQRQMAVANDHLLLGKLNEIQQDEVQLFPGVAQQPTLVLLHRSTEKGVGVGKGLVHAGLSIGAGQGAMAVKFLINVIDRQAVFFRQLMGNGGFAAARGTGDKQNVFQICFQHVILQFHRETPLFIVLLFSPMAHKTILHSFMCLKSPQLQKSHHSGFLHIDFYLQMSALLTGQAVKLRYRF